MAVAFQKTGFQSTGFQETGSVPVVPAFQSNAFQSTTGHVAFQTTVSAPVVASVSGYLGNFDVNNTFSKKRKKPVYEDVTRKVREREELRSDLDRAVALAEGAIEAVETVEAPQVVALAETAIVHAELIGVSPVIIQQLRAEFQAAWEAREAQRAFEEDEDEAITMLLLH